MPVSILPSFLLYCYITAITPGPANLCTLSTALRYGKDAALRQWRGQATGFFIDSMAAVLLSRLLGNVLGEYVQYLSWIGAAYILWLAWHILRSAGTPPEEDDRQPGFRTGLLVNLTNVKVIQTIMGHKDIQTTLDIYADCTEEKKKEVIHNIEDKIFIL